MKYTRVDRDGSFSIVGDVRNIYSIMMSIRMKLILASSDELLTGTLIAMRYSVVRR